MGQIEPRDDNENRCFAIQLPELEISFGNA
jgi:hypothetical protein